MKDRETGLLSDYYTVAELASELGITERSLHRYHWLRTGPKRTKIGGRVYFHKDAVHDWLKRQEVSA